MTRTKIGARNSYDYMWKVLSLYKGHFPPTDCVVSDREASTMTKPWPTKGYQAIKKSFQH